MTLEQVKEYLANHIHHQALAQDEMMRLTENSDRKTYLECYRVLANDDNYTILEWCDSCVMDMIKRVWAMYNELPKPEPINMKEEVKETKKKK